MVRKLLLMAERILPREGSPMALVQRHRIRQLRRQRFHRRGSGTTNPRIASGPSVTAAIMSNSVQVIWAVMRTTQSAQRRVVVASLQTVIQPRKMGRAGAREPAVRHRRDVGGKKTLEYLPISQRVSMTTPFKELRTNPFPRLRHDHPALMTSDHKTGNKMRLDLRERQLQHHCRQPEKDNQPEPSTRKRQRTRKSLTNFLQP